MSLAKNVKITFPGRDHDLFHAFLIAAFRLFGPKIKWIRLATFLFISITIVWFWEKSTSILFEEEWNNEILFNERVWRID